MTTTDASNSERDSTPLAALEEAEQKTADIERLAAEVEWLTQEALRLAEEKIRLEGAVARLTELLATKDALVDKLAKAVKDLRALKFGKRSEKLAPGQLALAFEDIALTASSLQAQIERIEDEAANLSGERCFFTRRAGGEVAPEIRTGG